MADASPGAKKARAAHAPAAVAPPCGRAAESPSAPPPANTPGLPDASRRSALRALQRVREEAFTAVSEVKLDGFKTRSIVDMLKSLTQDDHSVSTSHTLLLIGAQDNVVQKSAANIPGVEVIVAERVNVVDVVNSKRILATKDAITKLEEVLS